MVQQNIAYILAFANKPNESIKLNARVSHQSSKVEDSITEIVLKKIKQTTKTQNNHTEI